MNFDLSWILLGLPLAFVLGWLASRMDWRQMRLESQRAPKAYFKGLNYLLNEQQDQAIDAFIEAMQNDPDTAELHFALGNLFRRRGEYLRAVRVHEHLLHRADLSDADRQRAQNGLAQDYLKAGLLDRAEVALQRLEGTPFEAEARMALLAIYERSSDWPQAAAIVRKLQASGQGDFSQRLSHYECEQAAALANQGELEPALALLTQATQTAPTAPRPWLDLARLQHHQGATDAAWNSLLALAEQAPQALPLALPLLQDIAQASGQEAPAIALLRQRYAQTPSLDLVLALVQLQADPQGQAGQRCQQQDGTCSQGWLLRHLEQEPSLAIAHQWLATQGEHAIPPTVLQALEHASRPLMRYRCAACGFEARQHFWHCPGCQSWDSYPARRVEEL